MVDEIGRLRSQGVSSAEYEAHLNLHGILLKPAGEVVDFIDGHYVSTEDGEPLAGGDPFCREDALSVDRGLSYCELVAKPTAAAA
jgi:hypothetical protein